MTQAFSRILTPTAIKKELKALNIKCAHQSKMMQAPCNIFANESVLKLVVFSFYVGLAGSERWKFDSNVGNHFPAVDALA